MRQIRSNSLFPAFTLLELLVVIAIIVTLVSILFVAFFWRRKRKRAVGQGTADYRRAENKS